VGGLERALGHAEQVEPDGVEVDGLPQPGVERGHDGLRVVPGPVEPPVDQVLHPPAQRVEQGRDDQGGGGHRDRRLERQHAGGQQDQAEEHPGEHGGDQRVGDHPADDPVELVQPVLQHGHAQADRQGAGPDGGQGADHRLRAVPGGFPHGERDDEHADDQRDHQDGRAAVEPLELLPALAAGVPVRRYLQHDPSQPADQGRGDDHHEEDDQRLGSMAAQVAAGLDADVMPGDGQHAARRGGQGDHQPGDEEDHGPAVPAAGRERPVGEDPQQDGDEAQEQRPGLVEDHHGPAQRERPVAHPVIQDQVLARGAEPHDDDPE
jgi:hypothetical protein